MGNSLQVQYLARKKENNKSIPADFGRKNGSTISNKSTILGEIDAKLTQGRPPDVEYLLVRPAAVFRIPFTTTGVALNSYGHAVVRYTLPGGTSMLMNIQGAVHEQESTEEGYMVQLGDPEEYLFGTSFTTFSGGQRGVYNRSVMGIRIERVPPEKVVQMHNYFLELQNKEGRQHKARFSLFFGPLRNVLLRGFWRERIERGNCAYFTSQGLVHAGILKKPSMWPKSVWVHIFENEPRENVHVVSYKQCEQSFLSYGIRCDKIVNGVSPLQPLRNLAYVHLERFAHCIVRVPETKAEIEVVENPAPPSKLRNWLVNSNVMIFGSVFLVGAFAWKSLGSGATLAQRQRAVERIQRAARMQKKQLEEGWKKVKRARKSKRAT